MKNDLNLSAVKNYAEAYAEALAGPFFQHKEKISGEEIRSFSPVKQVNLFALRELFLIWREEIEKSKSPYFDYEDVEVMDALEEYQNALSNHISIRHEHFLPILKKAAYHCLLLALDPFRFYEQLMGQRESISLAALRNELKYIRLNLSPLSYICEYMQENDIKNISHTEADLIITSHIKETSFVPESEHAVIAKLATTLPVAIETFYLLAAKPTPASPPSAPVNLERPVLQSVAAPPKAQPAPVVPKNPFPAPTPNTTLAKTPSLEKKPAPTDNTAYKTVAHALGGQRIKNLKSQLSINQKFMFTKALFHGDFDIFERTIESIDRCDTLAQALRIITERHPEWDSTSEEYEEFMDLVNKRFV